MIYILLNLSLIYICKGGKKYDKWLKLKQKAYFFLKEEYRQLIQKYAKVQKSNNFLLQQNRRRL